MEQDVSMIRKGVDKNGRGIHSFHYRSHVRVQLRSDVIGQNWFTVFGAENQVNQDLRQRLGHELPPSRIACPFRAEFILALCDPGRCPGLDYSILSGCVLVDQILQRGSIRDEKPESRESPELRPIPERHAHGCAESYDL